MQYAMYGMWCAVVIWTRVCYGKRAILLGAEGKGVEDRRLGILMLQAHPV